MLKAFAAVMVLALVLGACSGDDAVSTTPTAGQLALTTVEPTTTAPQPPATTTTLPSAGIRVLTPEGCGGCDGLVTRLQELTRGEVPIEVRVEGNRSTVQVFDAGGALVREWRGDENTVHPTDRAAVDNAEEMIRVVCSALGTCPAEMTSTTTTVPAYSILQPNDFVCGMEVERRYALGEQRPAPLGVLAERWRTTSSASYVFSAILIEVGGLRVGEHSYHSADFCVGEAEDGSPIVARFIIGHNPDPEDVAVYSIDPESPGPQDLLPFGPGSELLRPFPREEPVVEYVLERLLPGRQYVFETTIGTEIWPPEYEILSIRDLDRYISGQLPLETIPNVGYISTWLTPFGSL